MQEGEIQQLHQLVTSQVEYAQLSQACKSPQAQALQLVACECELQQARLCVKGAWLQGAKAVVVQVETVKGGKGRQDAQLQA